MLWRSGRTRGTVSRTIHPSPGPREQPYRRLSCLPSKQVQLDAVIAASRRAAPSPLHPSSASSPSCLACSALRRFILTTRALMSSLWHLSLLFASAVSAVSAVSVVSLLPLSSPPRRGIRPSLCQPPLLIFLPVPLPLLPNIAFLFRWAMRKLSFQFRFETEPQATRARARYAGLATSSHVRAYSFVLHSLPRILQAPPASRVRPEPPSPSPRPHQRMDEPANNQNSLAHSDRRGARGGGGGKKKQN